MAVSFFSEIFFLPTLPSVAVYLNASKYDIQLTLPILLLGCCVSFIYSGPLSDFFGSKKILILQNIVYLLGLIITFFSHTIFVFLLGIFIQGLGAYYSLAVKYINESFREDPVKFFTIISFFGYVMAPISTTISGYLNHYFGWKYSFGVVILTSFVILIFLFFINEPKDRVLTKLDKREYMLTFAILIKNKNYVRFVIACSGISSAMYVFYTLSSYVFIVDFHLTSKQFGLLMFLPFLGCLMGSVGLMVLSKYIKSHVKIIYIGFSISIVGAGLIIIFSYLNSSPVVMMISVAIIMIGTPLVLNIGRYGAMSINVTIAGASASLFAIILNALGSVSSSFSAKYDGEIMGLLILGILILTLILVIFIKEKDGVASD